MKHFFILFFYSFYVICQIDISTIKIPKSLNETSGLEFFENYLITHNDSGDKPKLYIINKLGKKILEIEISQIKNKDWEDIASDENHFYIADTGNNFATRENLRIYILNKNFTPKGTINIRYKKQTTFSKETFNEFDAEGLAVFGEELILFSKNRKTLNSEIYTFPKKEGNYILTPKASIDTKSLITAADYSSKDDLMVLTGYNFDGDQFLCILKDFRKKGFENIDLKKYLIPIKPAQIEAIKIIDSNNFWLTSESEDKENPKLFRLKLKSN